MSIIGKWALVTGASSGLGVDFARMLAERGCHLILVARRTDLLEKVKTEIQGHFENEILLVSCDLSHPSGIQTLLNEIEKQKIQVDILINNAGFGIFKEFSEFDLAKQLNMIDLNIKTVVELSHHFGKKMKEQKFGYILNVASTAAFQPGPYFNVYCATKSFVLSFTEALHIEMAPHNVSVTTLCPGVTKTEFFDIAGNTPPMLRMIMMKSEQVCRIGLEALFAGKMTVIPGFINKLFVFSIRFTPRSLVAKVSGMIMKH